MSIKNILITGANRGIGLELCKQLSQLSTTEAIIATTRDRQNSHHLNSLSAKNQKIHVLELETRDYRLFDRFLNDCHLIVGTKGLNLLVNNAGIMSRDSLTTVTADTLSESFEVNAIAPLLLTRRVLPLLRTSAKNGETSAVVNISSILGTSVAKVQSGQQWYSYRISKASLNMITKLLAFDLSEDNVLAIDSEPKHQKQSFFRFLNLFKKSNKFDSNEKLIIRRMEMNDIKSALICLESLGFSESVSTLEAFYECDPNAFYVAINQNNDRIIGVCGAPVTIHSTGFFGLYGVDKSYQNKGIGRQLFELCLKHIGEKNCGLFSLPKKRLIYENTYGFKLKNSIELTIFAGIPQNIESINILIDENTEIKEFKREDTNLLTKIIEYDTKVHKQSRQTLLSLTLNKTDYKTFVIINKIDDRVLGYGCIRSDIKGIALIGPVYADNDCVAELLVYNLVKYCETSQTNGLLFPTINCCQTSHRIARKLLLKQFKNSPTLYTKYSPPLSHKFIYCIHSPNFSF